MCTEKKMHIKIRCIKYSDSKTNNKINTGYPIYKRSAKQLAGFYKTLGWILSTFGGANASAASTWFGLRHARRKIVVIQPTVVSSFGCFAFECFVCDRCFVFGMTSFFVGTNRTIGTNGPLELPCTQPDHMRT